MTGLSHQRPPQWNSESAPRVVVYIFGNPLRAIQSHYRRGQAQHQASKTSGRKVFTYFPESFEEYVEMDQDLFGVAEHIENWLNTPTEYEILFVRELLRKSMMILTRNYLVCRIYLQGVKTVKQLPYEGYLDSWKEQVKLASHTSIVSQN
eukprot:TRINITY_DN3965_c0_g1_i1.p2 TRINITY_DN3965_c0_g1~~TRINITY_DN3965_c0_g1_i1.p2  ORF type:complete len:150 (-),score=1.13 TRINITY_DN3965_c0_g1_i1:388-837(-)